MRPRQAPLERTVLLALCLLLAAASGRGETPPAAPAAEPVPAYTEKITVELVQVEVRVVDGKGEFVPGLSKQDFELVEDGVVQNVRFLDEFSAERPAPQPPVPGRVLGPDVTAPEPPEPPLRASLIVFLDGANSSASNISRHKNAVIELLRSLKRSDLRVAIVALMPDGGFRMLSDFSSDPGAGIQAVERAEDGTGGENDRESKYRNMETMIEERLNMCLLEQDSQSARICQEGAFERVIDATVLFAREEQSRALVSMDSIRDVLRFAGHVPGRRYMLMISEGFDVGGLSYFNAAGKLMRFYAQNFNINDPQRWIYELQRQSTLFGIDMPGMREVRDAALASGVTLYWVNPSHSGDLSAFSPESQLGSYTAGSDVVNAPDVVGLFRDLAGDTGGLALTRAAGVEGFLNKVRKDMGSYYVLGYMPSRAVQDGKAHSVKVRVLRPDLTVRMRKEILEPTRDERILERLGAALDFPEVFGSTGLAMGSRLSYLYLGGTEYAVAVQVAIPYKDLVPDVADGLARDMIHLGFSVRDGKGELLKSEHPLLDLKHNYEEYAGLVQAGAVINYRQSFNLAPGAYRLGAAVLDEAGGKTAATRHDLVLPALSGGCLAVTPLLIASRVAKLDSPAGDLRFDDHGDALLKDRRLSFSASLTLPPSGALHGLYQIVNAGHGPDGNPSVEISFRLFTEKAFMNETPVTRLARYTDAQSRTLTSYFAVPYSGLPDGAYRLELLAKDAITGCTSRGSGAFSVKAGAAEQGQASATGTQGSE